MKIWNSVLHPPRFSLGKRITLIPPHLTDTTTAHFTCAFTPLSPLSTKRNWKLWFFPLRYGIRSGNGNILLCHKLGIRSLLSWRFLSCGQSLLSSLMYWHFYLEANVQKKNLDLRWIGGCEKILFEVRSKREKRIGTYTVCTNRSKTSHFHYWSKMSLF